MFQRINTSIHLALEVNVETGQLSRPGKQNELAELLLNEAFNRAVRVATVDAARADGWGGWDAKKPTLALELSDLDIDVEGDLIPGCPATGPTFDCGGTPAEGPEVQDLTVNFDFKLDITDLLYETELEALSDKLMEAAE